MSNAARRIVQLAERGPVRASDLAERGWTRGWLRRLEATGELVRVSRGLYRAAQAEPTENGSLVEAQRRVPRAVIGLLSALQFHGLTSEAPHEVWILIPARGRKPRIDYPRLHVVRASGAALAHGVETHKLEGVNVRITSPAKTVADCFRYREHVGLETALEALRAYLARPRRGSAVDALVNACEADRVLSVVRPYLEALV
jgi:predicted transcriptional regulator of viral defense system